MVEVTGALELREVSLALKAAGLVDLRKEMNRNIRLATLPARAAVRASALATLPREGGLNQWVAKTGVTTSILTGTKTAGVVVKVRKAGHDMKDLDAGHLRHPVYARPGRKRTWVSQPVTPGFATKPMQALAPGVAVACYRAMRATAAAAGFK